MKRLFILLFWLFCLNTIALSQPENEIINAENLAQKGQFLSSNELLENFIKENPSRLYDLSSAWFLMSYNYLQLGAYQEALAANRESQLLKENLFSEDLAENHMREGAIYILQRDYERALNVLTAATELPIDDPQLYALLYAYISSAYQELGNYEAALQKLTESLEILEFELGEDHPDYATGTYDLGRLYAKMGKLEEAEAAYEKALEILKTNGIGKSLTPKIYQALGLLYHQDNWQKAFDYYQKSIKASDKTSVSINPVAAKTHLLLAKVWLNKFVEQRLKSEEENESVNSAIPSFAEKELNLAIQKITTSEGTVLDHQIYAEALTVKALNDLTIGSPDSETLISGLQLCETAVTHLFKQLDLINSEAAKFRLLEESHFIFESAISMAMQAFETTNDPKFSEKAFLLSEAAKAIVLSEGTTLSERQKTTCFSLKKAVCQAEARLLFAPEKIALHKNLAKHKKAYEEFLANTKNKGNSETYPYVSLTEIQQSLLTNQSILSYFTGEDAYYIFAITDKAFKAVALPVDFSGNAEIKQFKKIANLSVDPKKSTPGIYTKLNPKDTQIELNQSVAGLLKAIKKMEKKNLARYGFDLYKKLILPVENTIKSKASILISPHGSLFKIPFESLITEEKDPEGKLRYKKFDYLIEDYGISYTYSLKQHLQFKYELTKNYKSGFLGMAPIFKPENQTGNIQSVQGYIFDTTFQSDQNIRSILNDSRSFAPLVYSENEIGVIGNLFKNKKQKATTFYNEQASEVQFRQDCSTYEYIHLATHSFVHQENPKLSGIAFAQKSDDNQDAIHNDGILYAAEIPSLSINARLVVLSSCESSIGLINKGDGPFSLSRAFIEAGAKKVMASLWKVYDNHSQTFMISFYNELIKGATEGEATRKAKLKMIKSAKSANPKIWSGFILME